MSTRRRFSPAFLLFMLCSPVIISAADTDCAGTESGQKKADWIYQLPADRTKLPPQALLEKWGAFVLVDEVVYKGDDRTYTLMAMIGSRESIDAFGGVDFSTGFDSYADIKARVQGADGKPIELGENDIHCSIPNFDSRGHSIGKSFSPKHYAFNFKNLTPGAIIQYQISIKYHGSARYIDKNVLERSGPGYDPRQSTQIEQNMVAVRQEGDYYIRTAQIGDQYTGLYSIRKGAQERFATKFDEEGYDMRAHYPSPNVNFVLMLPKGMTLQTQAIPAGAQVEIKDDRAPDGSVEKIVRIHGFRPPMYNEPEAPPLLDRAPQIASFVSAIGKTSYAMSWAGVKDWKDWANRYANDVLVYARPETGALNAVLEAAPLTQGMTTRMKADNLNRYIRDVVSNDGDGDSIRSGAGEFRPIKFVVSQGKTGTATEKALALVSLFKASGITASLVYARRGNEPEIVKNLPMTDWFDYGLLVAAELEGKRVFYDPVHLVASGTLPVSVQGGEALLVSDRTTFEWLTLPTSGEDQNLSHAEFHVLGAEGSGLKGTLLIRLTGSFAENLRNETRGETPARINRLLTERLEHEAVQGVIFSHLTYANLANPDAPLEIKADFLFSDALRKLGDNSMLRPLPSRPGPIAARYAAEARQQDIVFRVPVRQEVVVHLPASLGKFPAMPVPVKLSGPGIEYKSEAQAVPEGVIWTRTTRQHGRVPLAQYTEFRAALLKLENADAAVLGLGK